MTYIKFTAILIAIIVLLAFLLLMCVLRLDPASAEMDGQTCEELVNSIFEADFNNQLDPPLDNRQILELNNACDTQLITKDDIYNIAPQYKEAESSVNPFLKQWIEERRAEQTNEE